jgi:hypothetical protein
VFIQVGFRLHRFPQGFFIGRMLFARNLLIIHMR